MSLTLAETLKTGFVDRGPYMIYRTLTGQEKKDSSFHFIFVIIRSIYCIFFSRLTMFVFESSHTNRFLGPCMSSS